MYPLSTLHAVTKLSGKSALEVEVMDSGGVASSRNYFNFVVSETGIMGNKLCYKDDIDDAFSMLRNAVC